MFQGPSEDHGKPVCFRISFHKKGGINECKWTWTNPFDRWALQLCFKHSQILLRTKPVRRCPTMSPRYKLGSSHSAERQRAASGRRPQGAGILQPDVAQNYMFNFGVAITESGMPKCPSIYALNWDIGHEKTKPMHPRRIAMSLAVGRKELLWMSRTCWPPLNPRAQVRVDWSRTGKKDLIN